MDCCLYAGEGRHKIRLEPVIEQWKKKGRLRVLETVQRHWRGRDTRRRKEDRGRGREREGGDRDRINVDIHLTILHSAIEKFYVYFKLIGMYPCLCTCECRCPRRAEESTDSGSHLGPSTQERVKRNSTSVY